MMRQAILLSAVVIVAATPDLRAQNEVSSGLRVNSVSVFMTYYSAGPLGGLSSGTSSLSTLSGVGASASLAYNRYRERSGLSINYIPTYISSLGSSTSGSANDHALTISWRRNVTAKWSYYASGSATVTSVSNSLFLPTTLSNVTSAPATFDDWAAAIVAGRLSNNQLASALTGAQTLESPAGIHLYGSRFLSAAGQGGMSYAYSSRLRVYFNLGATRAQPLKETVTQGSSQSIALLSHTTSGTASAGVAYALSTRTQFGVDVSESRTASNLQDAYATSSNASISRTMGTRWFLQVHAGAGFVRPSRQLTAVRTGVQWQGGGSIGYKTRAHSFIASVDRSVSDAYGYGAYATLTATGAWNWARPRSGWTLNANFAQQWLAGTVATVNTWRGTAGVSRGIGRHMAISAEYAYLSDPQVTGQPGLRQGQHVGRIAFVWIPTTRAIQQ